jgi:hypothetical protein
VLLASFFFRSVRTSFDLEESALSVAILVVRRLEESALSIAFLVALMKTKHVKPVGTAKGFCPIWQ